ncbi:hypothetical protein [Pinibacter soli]|uniref:Uncharacterized protein n=1 Tax=Pinibacter soli TaxID=3044211 RepID=A0ABT6R7I8_9BACT|nr:hypothetical protein [Pinibacter soli]MDI3318535.1 hypothetical protein [Pinibacter soli]
MTRDRYILNELFEISPVVTNISRQMPYEVPAGYFDKLPDIIMEMIANEQYESVSAELQSLSPLLNSIPKKTPYEINEDYFKDFSNNVLAGANAIDFVNSELENLPTFLEDLKHKQTYTVPGGYFETLPGAIFKELMIEKTTAPTQAKVIKGNFSNNISKYAAAAAIIGFVFIAGWLFWGNKPTPTNGGIAAIEKEVKAISDSDLNNFVEKNTLSGSLALYTDSTQLADDDVKYMLADIPDAELQQYLYEQTGTKAITN